MANMRIANMTRRAICASGARAFSMDFRTTCRPARYLHSPLYRVYVSPIHSTSLTWHARDQLERPEDPYGSQRSQVHSVLNIATSLVEAVLGTQDCDVTVKI